MTSILTLLASPGAILAVDVDGATGSGILGWLLGLARRRSA